MKKAFETTNEIILLHTAQVVGNGLEDHRCALHVEIASPFLSERSWVCVSRSKPLCHDLLQWPRALFWISECR
jgi:hypothetical protein